MISCSGACEVPACFWKMLVLLVCIIVCRGYNLEACIIPYHATVAQGNFQPLPHPYQVCKKV